MALFSDIDVAESDALEAIRDATTVAGWTNSAGWVIGDGTYDGNASSAHGVTVAGGHVTALALYNNALNGTFGLALFDDLPSCATFYGYSNANLIVTGSIADNSTLTLLRITNTSSVITGSIADNSTLIILYVDNTSSVITGSIADNSTLTTFLAYNTSSIITGALSDNNTLRYLQVNDSSSVITGGSSTLASYAYRAIWLHSTSLSTAQVDDIADALYRLRANFTYGTPAINISSNSAPFGVYQIGTQSTPAEKFYALVNDPNAEGFNTWAITYDNKGTYDVDSVLPVDGSTTAGLDVTIQSDVSVPDGGALTVRFYDSPGGSLLGTDAGVTGEGTASFAWNGRSSGTSYSWYITIDDAVVVVASATFTFTTPTGWTGTILGVDGVNLSKFNGVPRANIDKINGV